MPAAAPALSAAPRTAAPGAPGAPGVSLYVHWPFCASKCPYCDFNSHVDGAVDGEAWGRALAAELDHYAALAGPRTLETVFFGGGTPSLMPPAAVAGVLDRAARHWAVAPGAEVTLEANPSSAETARLADFRAAGVNRLSLGVQSLRDRWLAFLGRGHDAREARAAAAAAGRLFPRHSIDLIYALPGQRPEEWREDLRAAFDLAGDHLSLYQLAIERGTAFFAARRAGALEPAGDDLAAELMDLTRAAADAAGYPAYEVSNHAAPGGECRHNLACWLGRDYVGIGPGAHGRVSVAGRRLATEQTPQPAAWLAAVGRAGHGTRSSAPVDRAGRLDELLITGLRLTAGIDRRTFREVVGAPPEGALDMAAVEALERARLLRVDGAGIRATRAGLARLDSLVAALAR